MAPVPSLEEEFREFVAARSAALLRTAYLLAGDWASAEDLLQTSLTKTYLAWLRHGGIEAIEPYARRVLVNTATSWRRRRWHGERPTETLPEQPGPDRHAETVERDLLWRHVRALPVRQRAVLVLRYYEDLSEAQTAELLEISPGTVKSQTARALATLRKKLRAEGVMPQDAPVAPGPTESSGRTATTPLDRGAAPVAPAAASAAPPGESPARSPVPPLAGPPVHPPVQRRPDAAPPAEPGQPAVPRLDHATSAAGPGGTG